VTNDKEHSDKVAHSATPCGAELWSAMKYDDQASKFEMLGFEPHFFGSSRIAVNVEETNEDHSGCEAWLKTRTDYPGQLEFSCPNYLLYKNKLKKRPNAIVQVAAFAEQIETYDSVEKFDEEQSKLPSMIEIVEGEVKINEGDGRFRAASKSFVHPSVFERVPTQYRPSHGPDACKAVLTGHVLETELKVNEKTGHSFYWALVDTLHGQMDVVIDPSCLKFFKCKPPKVGGVVGGTFWLSGRIMDRGEMASYSLHMFSSSR
jgi:hypothetical protein